MITVKEGVDKFSNYYLLEVSGSGRQTHGFGVETCVTYRTILAFGRDDMGMGGGGVRATFYTLFLQMLLPPILSSWSSGGMRFLPARHLVCHGDASLSTQRCC